MSLDDNGLDLLFRQARTHSVWQSAPVSRELIQQVFDLARMGPTSANCSPARLIFVQSQEARERLRPALSRGNVDKTMSAPVTVLVGHDTRFFESLPFLFPHDPGAAGWFTGNAALANETALRNGSLQGAYLIMAARALGLDVGPLSGFDAGRVEEEFFPGGRVRCNFICNLGHGQRDALRPRLPRWNFEQVCQIV